MTNRKSKKIIEEAIEASMLRRPLNEGPIDYARSIGSGIKGAGQGVVGNFRVNRAKSYMDNMARKMEKSVNKYGQKAKGVARKMQQSSNDSVSATGDQIEDKVDDATNKVQGLAREIKKSFPSSISGGGSERSARVKGEDGSKLPTFKDWLRQNYDIPMDMLLKSASTRDKLVDQFMTQMKGKMSPEQAEEKANQEIESEKGGSATAQTKEPQTQAQKPQAQAQKPQSKDPGAGSFKDWLQQNYDIPMKALLKDKDLRDKLMNQFVTKVKGGGQSTSASPAQPKAPRKIKMKPLRMPSQTPPQTSAGDAPQQSPQTPAAQAQAQPPKIQTPNLPAKRSMVGRQALNPPPPMDPQRVPANTRPDSVIDLDAQFPQGVSPEEKTRTPINSLVDIGASSDDFKLIDQASKMGDRRVNGLIRAMKFGEKDKAQELLAQIRKDPEDISLKSTVAKSLQKAGEDSDKGTRQLKKRSGSPDDQSTANLKKRPMKRPEDASADQSTASLRKQPMKRPEDAAAEKSTANLKAAPKPKEKDSETAPIPLVQKRKVKGKAKAKESHDPIMSMSDFMSHYFDNDKEQLKQIDRKKRVSSQKKKKKVLVDYSKK